MARRNPMNERYGKHTAPSGKTRKSAASAKPKRPASAPASGSKRVAPSASKRQERLRLDPQTPEFKKWRRIWWGCLGLAIVLSTAAWWLWRDQGSRSTLGGGTLAAGYVMIFVALAIDWLKLRPMRKAWLESGSTGEAKQEKPKQVDESKATAEDRDKS
jgi:hypothetical protein